ncbi:uncharacterized protein BDV17DRAFT_295695 [Aspergillus undulatus]|uniref:uncharacterized protein n=1 Tax=Aspergillus undulatus TaxID=1810928 RepID=UPI003CCCDAD7
MTEPVVAADSSRKERDDSPTPGETDSDDKNASNDHPNVEDAFPAGPWGNRCVTSRRVGTKKPPEKDSSLNVRINLDLRADVALELHAVLQGDITVGLF